MARIIVDTTVALRPMSELLEDCLRMIQEQIDHFKHRKSGTMPFAKNELDMIRQMATSIRMLQSEIKPQTEIPLSDLTDEELDERAKKGK